MPLKKKSNAPRFVETGSLKSLYKNLGFKYNTEHTVMKKLILSKECFTAQPTLGQSIGNTF
jgi:hypothetical protein